MEQKNLDYLKKSLLYMGFGDGLNEKLETAMKQGLPEFSLQTQNSLGKDKMDYSVNFKRGREDIYFLNNYDAKLTKTNGKSEDIRVYNDKGKNITAKEAYNLLSGRAVYQPEVFNKEGGKYDAWVKLDFSVKDQKGKPLVETFTKGYGYDLEKTLEKHPIEELADPEKKANLIKSLQRGNRQAVEYDFGGNIEKAFVEANPKFKAVNVYDGTGKKIYIPQEINRGEKGQTVKSVKKKNENSAGVEKKSKISHKPKKQKSAGRKM